MRFATFNPSEAPPTSGRQRRPHQVRTHLGSDLYERILREAAVQRRSVSECVHDALEDLYAIRDELSHPREAGVPGSAGGQLTHRLLGQLEERMAGAFSRQLDEIRSLRERLRRLEAMNDRQYVSLMRHLPDISIGDGSDRTASARMFESWQRAVAKLVDTSSRRP